MQTCMKVKGWKKSLKDIKDVHLNSVAFLLTSS